jgi:hypothetical protein
MAPLHPTVSYSQQFPHELGIAKRQVGKANGVASLDADLRVPQLQIPFGGKAGTEVRGGSRAAGSSGVAGLDADGKLYLEDLPASLLGGLTNKGVWHADQLPAPPLPAGSATGSFYIVSGATPDTKLNDGAEFATSDLVGDWQDGDLALWVKGEEGAVSKWYKLEGGNDRVLSVNSKLGAVSLALADIEGNVGFDRLAAGTLSAAQFGDESVTAPAIQLGSITNDHIQTGTLSWPKFAADTVVPVANLDPLAVIRRELDGATGTLRIHHDDLPADLALTSDLPSLAAGFTFAGEWTTPGAAPAPALGAPLVNGSFFPVNFSPVPDPASIAALPDASGVAITGWANGDLAVWVKKDEVSGFWLKIQSRAVSTVAGRTGDVVLTFADLSGAVTNAQLGADCVQNENIMDGAITAAKIAAGTITGDRLANGAIETANLADGAITQEKLATDFVLPASTLPKRVKDRSYWPAFKGGVTRTINYDCESSLPVEFPSKVEDGVTVTGAPRIFHQFLNAGAGFSSTNNDEKEADGVTPKTLPVLGSICIKHILPLDFDETVSPQFAFNLATRGASRVTLRIYDSRGVEVKSETLEGVDHLLPPFPTEAELASATLGGDNSKLITAFDSTPRFPPGGEVTIVLDCEPAPAAPEASPPTTADQGAVRVECISLRYTVKPLESA